MSSFDRVSARPAILAQARSLIGVVPYRVGGAHSWVLGEPRPSSFDCSGLVYWNFLELLGINLAGTSETQWAAAVGGRIDSPADVLPGQLVYFTDTSFPDPGHIGIIATFNEATKQGTYVSAYDTARGIIEHSWEFGVGTFYGITDPIATLPVPPPPAPSEETMNPVLTKNPNNGGTIVLDTALGTFKGLSNPAVEDYLENVCKIPEVATPSKAVFAKFTQTGTI